MQESRGTFVLLPAPMSPKVVLPPGASDPFHGALTAVTAEPLTVAVAPQTMPWAMDCPSPQVQITRQPETRAVPAVTVTSAWNPPGQELFSR